MIPRIMKRIMNITVAVFSILLLVPLCVMAVESARTAVVTVQGEELAGAARAFIGRQLSWLAGNLEIETLSVPRDMAVPEGDVQFSVDEGSVSRFTGSVSIPVTVKVDGRKVAVAYPRLMVRVYEEVAVAQRPLPRDAVISPADITLQRRDVSGLERNYYTSAEQLAGKRTKLRVGVGTLIMSAMIAVPSMINRGDAVEIVAENGGCRITARGIAAEDGSMGEVIRVTNAASRRMLRATVTEPGRVCVSEGGEQ